MGPRTRAAVLGTVLASVVAVPASAAPPRGGYRPNRFDGPAGVYEDRAADYVTSEPAIVYAASAVLLFAAMAG
jgi:hypothetical protein